MPGSSPFAHSAKHVGLYGKFGFHPPFLTAIRTAPSAAQTTANMALRYSVLPGGQRREAENARRELTETAGSRALPSATGVRQAKPAKAAVTRNSARCGPDRVWRSASARC
jgi:hypothetical protein